MKIYTRTLTEAELTTLLAAHRPQLPFAIVERPDSIRFPASETPLLPAEWPCGRAFGATVEVQWRAQTANFHTLWIAENPPATEWSLGLDLASCESAFQPYFLWGPDNIALGAPPVYEALPEGQGHPQIVFEEFRDAANGAFVFARAVAMQREGN